MNSKKALELLETRCRYFAQSIMELEETDEANYIIKQDLNRLEKFKQAFKILKDNYFTVTPNANSKTGYIMCVESAITQKEYELLKKVLENE